MTTSIAQLASDVYTLTSRSDLVAETGMAIRAATLKAHQSDYYYKDLYETAVQFDTSDYQQVLQYKQLLPLWRALKYLRKYDNVNLAPGEFLNIVSIDTTQDAYRLNKEDIAYVAGTQINIRSRDLQQYYLLGCYLNPDVTPGGYNSWIADDHPFAIIYEAARSIFAMIGFQEQAAGMNQLVAEQYQILKSEIVAVGY